MPVPVIHAFDIIIRMNLVACSQTIHYRYVPDMTSIASLFVDLYFCKYDHSYHFTTIVDLP